MLGTKRVSQLLRQVQELLLKYNPKMHCGVASEMCYNKIIVIIII
jgi:hypothetical protein